MKLTDLNPRWYVYQPGGPRIGLTFDCPHCNFTRLGVAFHHKGHELFEDNVVHVKHPTEYVWNLDSKEDFATLTLTPSIDASKSGHWHGFITNGEIK